MRKIVFLSLIVSLSLSAIAQKRVAVYVDGPDATLTDYVTGEMVRVISQSRDYIAVNRSDDFSKQLQSERFYQQSGMVNDNQIAQLGKESGVDYVCAIKITETVSSEYSIEARLIDVETGDIKASDRRSAKYYGSRSGMSHVGFKYVDEATKKISSTIMNSEYRSYRSGLLQYSDHVESRVVQNNYGEEQELKESDVRSLLVANPEAFDLYEKGIKQMNTEDRFGFKLLACAGTLISAGVTIEAFAEDSAVPAGKAALCVMTAGFASWWTYEIFHPKIAKKNGAKKIKRAIGLYNGRNSYADKLELSVGLGMNSVGLTLKF